MKNELHLFINGQELELREVSAGLLYTYEQTKLTNPTAVKNSFSKTIAVYGTPKNNAIFEHYWNVERLQGDMRFNASKKVPFQLFLDSELYESGYVKLDEIVTNKNIITYNITLYGGLGEFFWNLSTKDDSDTKMKLSDLIYGYDDNDFKFTINIDTVKAAWEHIEEDDDDNFWKYINFATAYNGYPSDFDCNTVMLDTKNTPLVTTKFDDSKTYRDVRGFIKGNLPENMSEWEIRDLRSYLQRPCIRMKEIIKACCNPENNGGYTVNLDPDFFNSDNPYWEKTWLTLPQLTSLEYASTTQIVDEATIIASTITGTEDSYMLQNLTFNIGELEGSTSKSATFAFDFSLQGSGSAEGAPEALYPSFVCWKGASTNQIYDNASFYGGLFCQLLAYNGDTVVAASKAKLFTNHISHNGSTFFADYNSFAAPKFEAILDKGVETVPSYFKRDGNVYRLSYMNSDSPMRVNFTLDNIASDITGLKLLFYWGANSNKIGHNNRYTLYGKDKAESNSGYSLPYFTILKEYMDVDNIKTSFRAIMGDSIGRTGTVVYKTDLLNTEYSPCEYLLSYCKMFGLYFVKDIESPTVDIMTRNTFYKRNEIVNINDDIDRSDISMTPIAFSAKWYKFVQEIDDSELFAKNYMATRGIEYGCRNVNTGYEFDTNTTNLLEDNCIRSAVEALEKSKYYTMNANDKVLRPWFTMGMTTELVCGEDDSTYTLEQPLGSYPKNTVYPINENENLKYYDFLPKLQFHNDSTSPTDGNNVLVFFSGKRSLTLERANAINYILSDDSNAQVQLNDGKPCWLFTANEFDDYGNRICHRLTELPVFERYLTSVGSNIITDSLDFGSPQELYVPNYKLTEDKNIYSRYWKTYIEDMFDINTRILKCKIRLEGKPNSAWLRRFYWFDNAIWRLNSIKDWNPISYDLTDVEFIKVQDIENYTNGASDVPDVVTLKADKTLVTKTGGTITLTITCPYSWWINCNTSDGVSFSSSEGVGNATVTMTIAPTLMQRTDKYIYVRLYDNKGNAALLTVIQRGDRPIIGTITTKLVGGALSSESIQLNITDQLPTQIYHVNQEATTGDMAITTSINDANNLTVAIAPNLTNRVKSEELVLDTDDGLSTTVQMDQIPSSINASSATCMVLDFKYNQVEVLHKPDWITETTEVDEEGYTHTIYCIEMNPTTLPRTATLTFTNGIDVVSCTVTQSGGLEPVGYITPETLYFNTQGGMQEVSINTLNPWFARDYITDWCGMTVNSGPTPSSVWISCQPNSGEARETVMTIVDLETREEFTLTIKQAGTDTTRTMTVSPISLSFTENGGTKTITVNYDGRYGDYVELVSYPSELSVSEIVWDSESQGRIIVKAQSASGGILNHGTITIRSLAGTKSIPVRYFTN